jgi:hypothetical protein
MSVGGLRGSVGEQRNGAILRQAAPACTRSITTCISIASSGW